MKWGEDRGLRSRVRRPQNYKWKRTAHRAFDGTDFHRLCSSDPHGELDPIAIPLAMGSSILNSIRTPSAITLPIHTGDHDDNHGQGNIASKLFRHTHADSSGD